jgi:hypothetical protein
MKKIIYVLIAVLGFMYLLSTITLISPTFLNFMNKPVYISCGFTQAEPLWVILLAMLSPVIFSVLFLIVGYNRYSKIYS